MSSMIHTHSFHELRSMYAAGSLTPSQVAASALEHAAQVNPVLNAFAWLDVAGAHASAEASTHRWCSGKPLSNIDGMVIAIKEFAAVKGWPTRRGSLLTDESASTFDSLFVNRLKAAGAILLGKTRSPELNWKGVTDSPGFGITRNPLDVELTPGGSSGGCSAAVAAGVVRVSIGSDAAGSVRIPAAFTGILGLKPTQGRIPIVPYASHFSGLAHFGPLGRCPHDIADVLEVIAGADPNDWTSTTGNTCAFLSSDLVQTSSDSAIRSLRVGVVGRHNLGKMASTVEQGLEEFIHLIEHAGLTCRSVELPLHDANQAASLLYRWGCAQSVKGLGMHDPAIFQQKLDPGLHDYLTYANNLTVDRLTHALAQRDRFASQLNTLFEQYDVLILPTVGILPFKAGQNTPDPLENNDWLSWNNYTPAFNLVRNPVLSYPVWSKASNLPIGVQIVSRPLEENTLLGLADALLKTEPDMH